MWTTFDRSKTIFYTFTYDHQYFSSDSRNEGSEKGTWTKESDNSYNVVVDGRKTRMIVYQPTTDSIAQADTPEIRFTPKPVSTPRPAQTQASTNEPALEIGPFKLA